jgi:type I restriction enzyme, S subunit
MKLPAYPKYRPSGVDWLGDVPAHWEVKRLKTSATCWVSNVDKVPAEDEVPVRLCNYTDVYYNDHISSDMNLMETTATADEIRRFGLQVGDVLITKDSEEWSDIAVPALVKKSSPDLVCGYHLAIIRSHPKALNGDYTLRAFQSCAVNQQFQVAASGVTRYGLPKASIGDAWVPLPDVVEQKAIAAFLDRETERLDRLVAKKQELIERLKEKRTALISRTVTHGLPAEAAAKAGVPINPALKPSGLDWLGDIPEHWELIRLGRKIELQRGVDITKDTQNEGSIPVVSSGGISSFHDRAIADGPGVIVGRKGTAGAVYYIEPDFWPHDTTLYVKDFGGNNRRFVYYKLFSMNLEGLDTGSANPTLNRNVVHPIWVSWPQVSEQIAIVTFLDAETAKLDSMVAKVEEAIERLQEYRTALITAAVTGKVDCRKVGA